MKWPAPNGRVYDIPDAASPGAVARFKARVSGTPAPPGFVAAAPESSRAPNDVGNRDWTGGGGQSLGRFALNSLPTVGGMAGDVIGGALATPLDAFMGPAGTYAGGVTGAGLGGMTGEGARQLILRAMGHPQADPWGEMQRQGRAQALGAAGGRVVSGLVGHMAPGLMRGALREGAPIQREAEAVANRGARKAAPVPARALGPTARVNPEAAGLDRQALRERTPVGERPFIGGGAGSNQVQSKINKALADGIAARDEATAAGQTRNIHSITGSKAIQTLRDFIESPGNVDKDTQTAWLNTKLKQLVGNNQGARVGGKLGTLRRFTPQELEDMQTRWQKGVNYDKPVADWTLTERLNDALSRAANEQLESLPNGWGQRIAQANARASSLIPLKEGTVNAERGIVRGGGFKLSWPEITAGGIGGGAGYAGTHNPMVGGGAAAATAFLAHMANDPAIVSRLALGMDSPLLHRMTPFGIPTYGALPLLGGHALAGFGVPPQDVPAPPGRQPGPNARGR